MSKPITRLHLLPSKCVPKLTLDLHPKLTVLIGDNGSGKSTILDAARDVATHTTRGLIVARPEPAPDFWLQRALIWEHDRTIQHVQLVLPDVQDISRDVRYSNGRRAHLDTLAAGERAYLNLVGMITPPDAALIIIDDIEQHLHPAVIPRVMFMLEDATAPVIISTHSDIVLDMVQDIASIVLCERDASGQTTIRRPDPETAATWVPEFRGFGALRAAGYQPHVFEKPRSEPKR